MLQNEADTANSPISAWFEDGRDDFLETEEDEEDEDEAFEYAVLEEMQYDWEKRALVTRVTNMLRKYRSQYGIQQSNSKPGKLRLVNLTRGRSNGESGWRKLSGVLRDRRISAYNHSDPSSRLNPQASDTNNSVETAIK